MALWCSGADWGYTPTEMCFLPDKPSGVVASGEKELFKLKASMVFEHIGVNIYRLDRGNETLEELSANKPGRATSPW